jgi:DNA repair protein RadD
MRFEELLARADDEALQQLLGAPIVRLLNLLDPSLARPTKLRELITSFRPPEELLRDPASRQILVDLLPKDEAVGIADILGLFGPDPFEQLRSARVRKGSPTEQRLFSALGVVPTELDHPEQAPALVQGVVDYGLFAHQRLAARRTQALLDERPNRVLLHMPTGSASRVSRSGSRSARSSVSRRRVSSSMPGAGWGTGRLTSTATGVTAT